MIARRRLFAIALLAVGLLVSASFAMVRPIWASEAAAWQALDQGAIVLFRHANAPGTGDALYEDIADHLRLQQGALAEAMMFEAFLCCRMCGVEARHQRGSDIADRLRHALKAAFDQRQLGLPFFHSRLP